MMTTVIRLPVVFHPYCRHASDNDDDDDDDESRRTSHKTSFSPIFVDTRLMVGSTRPMGWQAGAKPAAIK